MSDIYTKTHIALYLDLHMCLLVSKMYSGQINVCVGDFGGDLSFSRGLL